MSVILMTTLSYKALILQGEIWCWSLLGLKGLTSENLALFHTKMCDFLYHQSDLKRKIMKEIQYPIKVPGVSVENTLAIAGVKIQSKLAVWKWVIAIYASQGRSRKI